MDHLRWEMNPPKLRDPMMVCAFRGWNDAASAASSALETLADSLEVDVLAELDPEDFYDFQANRPTVRLEEGAHRRIEWPANTFIAARAQGAERDLILLDGTEPNLKWRTYSEMVVQVAEQLDVRLVVVLGSLIAEVAHTLPVPITGVSTDEQTVRSLELERSDYEGPTGIVGVIHDRCRAAGLPSVSLWAAVPHYVAAVPNPKAALALSEKLESITRVAADISGLEDETISYEDQIGRAVAADPEVEELVERIENEQRSRRGSDVDVPSGDALAIEFQRFLKQRDSE
ncbi:MAG: PAC2 family protein [Solirubrobacterales bacterium]|nr:PAC2 family protein [Solirubrobacterales bacterium]